MEKRKKMFSYEKCWYSKLNVLEKSSWRAFVDILVVAVPSLLMALSFDPLITWIMKRVVDRFINTDLSVNWDKESSSDFQEIMTRFEVVAELQRHQAFRIKCDIETKMLSPHTAYAFQYTDTSMLLLSLSKVLAPFFGPLDVIGTVLYVLSFSLGAGPVPALLLPEIFASRIRAKKRLPCHSECIG
ncbi:hypothetical protein Tco_0502700 [Tanacetum coccineum]